MSTTATVPTTIQLAQVLAGLMLAAAALAAVVGRCFAFAVGSESARRAVRPARMCLPPIDPQYREFVEGVMG